jgi:cation:H+ antiporter
MSVLLAVIIFVLGSTLTVKGSGIFIDAAGWVSDVTGISRVVIGATIVSLATTAPEYFVSLVATLKGYNDLAVGNAVGSLIANIGFVFALLAIFAPGKVADKLFGVKGLIMIGATVFLTAFCFNGQVTVGEGIVLLLVFTIFTFINIRFSKESENLRELKKTNRRDITSNVAKFIGGAAAIVFGSILIVDNAKIIAVALGASETLIGLTIVALGTSLPEAVTSVAAIVKKQNALSIGNIIGANILDATLILATGAFVSGGNLLVAKSTITIALPVTLLLMLIAVLPTAIGKRIYRCQGILLVAVNITYLICVSILL